MKKGVKFMMGEHKESGYLSESEITDSGLANWVASGHLTRLP